MRVTAHIFTDDRVFDLKLVDVTPWFESATLDQLLELCDIGMGHDYASDRVAEFMADRLPELGKLFDYLVAVSDRKDAPGYECDVDPAGAFVWIAEHRASWLGSCAMALAGSRR